MPLRFLPPTHQSDPQPTKPSDTVWLAMLLLPLSQLPSLSLQLQLPWLPLGCHIGSNGCHRCRCSCSCCSCNCCCCAAPRCHCNCSCRCVCAVAATISAHAAQAVAAMSKCTTRLGWVRLAGWVGCVRWVTLVGLVGLLGYLG